ncbi:MAG TPA: transporter, partial [Phycisphaerae bacterium]|nr:transporter [Phycisphaerae bacterium]
GVKVPLLREKKCLPNVSFIYEMSIPTGSSTKSSDDVGHFFSLPWNYAITKKITAFGSLAGTVTNSPTGQFFAGQATLGGAYHATDWMTLYTEYFTRIHNTEHGDCLHVLSAGPIFWLTDNISIDTRIGVGLNEEAPDFQTSVGMGIRF